MRGELEAIPEGPEDWLRRRVSELTPEALAEFKDDVTQPVSSVTEVQLPFGRDMWVQVFLGHDVILTGRVENMSIDRSYVDATVFGSTDKVYLTGEPAFTILGRQKPLPKGIRHERSLEF